MFVLGLLVLLWLFQIVFLEQFYRAITTNNIVSAADNLAENIDHTDFNTLVENIAQSQDIGILVVDENNLEVSSYRVSYLDQIHGYNAEQLRNWWRHTEAEGGVLFKTVDRNVKRPTQLQPKEQEVSQSSNGGEAPPAEGAVDVPPKEVADIMWKFEVYPVENMIYSRIVERADGSRVLILLDAMITPVGSTVKTLQIQLVCITVVMLIVALLLALIISKRVSSPISTLSRSAKELAKGHYDTVFVGGGYQEIAELRDSLNYAAGELGKVESLRQELIANISHDLRTPLTMISGYAEVMRDLPGENTPENVQIIIDEAQRLNLLVTDILDYSKFQTGMQTLNRSRYNFTDEVRSIADRIAKLTESQGYTLIFEADRDVWIDADEIQMSQVIYNLINNALTYTGQDKKVLIRQTVKDGTLRLEVEDSGEGIPEAELPYIWDRYYRAKSNHRRGMVGSGLGLSIVRTVLELHGASYGVESEVGKGSIFWFEIEMPRENA